MRVVFMGTPQFAVPTLQRLVEDGHEVVAVVTQPDAPKGRGKQMVPSPVKEYAMQQGLLVETFSRIRSEESAQKLESFGADVIVTAAYGQILSQRNLQSARFGVINAHASLLPKLRGSAPIQWAIIRGEKRTGVTAMQTALGVDTGDILKAVETEILPDETAGMLTERLSKLAAPLISEVLRDLAAGTLERVEQDESLATHCPMLKKTDGSVNFSKTAEEISCLVRGVDPWPGAYLTLENGERLRVFSPVVVSSTCKAPGTIVEYSQKDGILFACAEGAIRFLEVQAAGKRRISDTEYVRGHRAIALKELP